MKPKIVVVGSSNTDMIVHAHHLPEPGETVLGGDYIESQGGKGANQAVAAARLGADVAFIARIGRDAFGNASMAAYKAEGISVEYIVRDDNTSSGVALIIVNRHGENVIVVAQGANANLCPADVLAAESAIKGANCLLVQLEIPLETVQTAIQLAVKHQVPVILNPAPATQLSPKMLEMVDYLTPNETEAAFLAGGYSANKASDAAYILSSKFKVKNIVITLGEKGAMITGFHKQTVPSYSVNSIDATGAGDAFNGGLAVALARGDKIIDAVKFANAAAALSTTKAGAQPSMPTAKDVQTFLETRP